MELASWFLAALGAIGVYISGKNRWGWAIGVLYQVLWIVYAYFTQQYGFIGVCVVYAVLYAKNFYEGGKNSDRDALLWAASEREEHMGEGTGI